MAKDPAFLFYPNDFDSATKFFTDEQVGKYLRLLIAQFQHGRLNEKQVLFICKSYDEDIMNKFLKDENNLYYNERLESEINKRKKFTASRSNNRKCKKDEEVINISNSYDKHMNNHMENENENENKNKIKLKGKFFLSSDFEELPEQFLNTSIELIRIQKQITLTKEKVLNLWELFKVQNLVGEKFYNSKNNVYQHFTNWLKLQKFENGNSKTRQQTTNESLEYLTNKGQELYAQLYGSDSKS